MLLLLAVIALVWLALAVATIAVCAYARVCDDEIARADALARSEQVPIIKITSAA